VLRALTAAEERKWNRIRERFDAEWRAGTYASVEELKEARDVELAKIGIPIPPTLVERAIHEHGHLGTRALDVAATWALAQLKNPPVAPRRKTPQGARSRTLRRRTSGGSSRDGPRREPDDDDLVPLPARVPAAPLVSLLSKRLEQGWTVEALAEEAEIPARRIRSIVNGEQERVAFDTADAIVSRIFGVDVWEVELADLYGAAA
jgi:hypothetical protein